VPICGIGFERAFSPPSNRGEFSGGLDSDGVEQATDADPEASVRVPQFGAMTLDFGPEWMPFVAEP
jgi:hypothetical protein